MDTSFFSPRKRFSLSPHSYDLGTIFGLWHHHDDNHFLLKIYRIEATEFADYYNYHLNYAVKNSLVTEEDFFRHVVQIVNMRIKHFEIQDPFSSNHAAHKRNLNKLRLFQKYLGTIDQWNARPSRVVIDEKNAIIQSQKKDIEELKVQLMALKEYEVTLKVMIADGHLPTFIDLIQQMRELHISETRKLLKSDHKIPFAKMIAKYFSHGGNNIPIETARNYFVEGKGDVSIKGTAIPPAHRLFKIVHIAPVKK